MEKLAGPSKGGRESRTDAAIRKVHRCVASRSTSKGSKEGNWCSTLLPSLWLVHFQMSYTEFPNWVPRGTISLSNETPG